MAHFDHNDVITLATAVVNSAVQAEYQGDYGKHEYLDVCMFCRAEAPSGDSIEHELDCPYRIAQDLLT